MRSLFSPKVCQFVNQVRPSGITSCGSECPGVMNTHVFPPPRHSLPVSEDCAVAAARDSREERGHPLPLSETDLSRWERVSKMRFKHENVHLVPYPYICTMYLELNSFQQNVSCGKEVKKESDELVERNAVSESTTVEKTVKRRRLEVRAETSCPQPGTDRPRAECVHHMNTAKHGFEKNHSRENECEFSPASRSMGCNHMRFWGPVEPDLEQRAAAGQAEGAVQLVQQMAQTVNKGNVEPEGRGRSAFWRSIIFLPLQHLFGGKN
ncbi:membrane-anchored junction protein isoform X2 [Tyto alba]|uniref:membrane-anchored junction protein isoform X2 n=1 Tax=Tyto alba TaxID=56313 RepID=UPI001C669BF5|nr:membrane-anchored junction protein isoform X2 [Tyto alba]